MTTQRVAQDSPNSRDGTQSGHSLVSLDRQPARHALGLCSGCSRRLFLGTVNDARSGSVGLFIYHPSPVGLRNLVGGQHVGSDEEEASRKTPLLISTSAVEDIK